MSLDEILHNRPRQRKSAVTFLVIKGGSTRISSKNCHDTKGFDGTNRNYQGFLGSSNVSACHDELILALSETIIVSSFVL